MAAVADHYLSSVKITITYQAPMTKMMRMMVLMMKEASLMHQPFVSWLQCYLSRYHTCNPHSPVASPSPLGAAVELASVEQLITVRIFPYCIGLDDTRWLPTEDQFGAYEDIACANRAYEPTASHEQMNHSHTPPQGQFHPPALK